MRWSSFWETPSFKVDCLSGSEESKQEIFMKTRSSAETLWVQRPSAKPRCQTGGLVRGGVIISKLFAPRGWARGLFLFSNVFFFYLGVGEHDHPLPRNHEHTPASLLGQTTEVRLPNGTSTTLCEGDFVFLSGQTVKIHEIFCSISRMVAFCLKNCKHSFGLQVLSFPLVLWWGVVLFTWPNCPFWW